MYRRRLLPLLRLWFFIALTWGAVRVASTQPEWVEEIVLKPLIYLSPLLVVLYRQRRLNREALGLRITDMRSIGVWGLGFGFFLVGESVAVSLIRQHAVNYDFFTLSHLGLSGLISLSTAVSEEMLYRGYLLERITFSLGSEIRANFVVSVLFMLAHLAMAIFILHIRGLEMVGYLWLIFILGFADGILYLKTRSVVTPIIAHALWNFSNGFFVRG